MARGRGDGAVRLGNLEVDLERYLVRIDGRLILLSYLQFRCLRLLVQRRGSVISREALCRELWGSVTREENRRLNSQVSTLRQRLQGSAPWTIRTVHHHGYVLTDNPPEGDR